MRSRISVIFLFLFLGVFFYCNPAHAISEEEKTFLSMYFTDEELVVVSTTRSLQSITRVAENVEVVTKDEIELMNAHTLLDVLNTINGVEIQAAGASPGSAGMAQIQGSFNYHVIVLVDGVNINDIAGGVALIELIPAQIIKKVEVIKGPASSVWGSSLGGIVNVITKTPSSGDKPSGIISGSYGNKNSWDFDAEIGGKKGGVGYYLFAGRLQTDGLRPQDDNWHNSLFSKFTYDFSPETLANLSILYTKSEEAGGDFDALGFRVRSRYETILSSLSVNSRLNDIMKVEVSARMASKIATGIITDLPSGTVTEVPSDDKKYGLSIKFDLRKGMHAFVFGGDYDFNRTKFSGLTFDEKTAAVYINDTISLGKLSVIPGLRFDDMNVKGTSLNENFFSPSLGVTYEIADKTLLRGVVARGFNIPPVFDLFSDSQFFIANPHLHVETVWSYQAGVETGALKYLWLKVSGFRHDIRDAIEREDVSVADQTWTLVNKGSVRRQGLEVEIKTVPFHNVTFTAATSYVKSKDLETGETISFPAYTYDAGLQYDDKKTLRALIRGRSIWWNTAEDWNSKYNGFIVDADVIKKLYKKEMVSIETFLTGHNLFNGSSYWLPYYKNARRWIEGGIRVKF